jgi:hypothetical protein
MHATIVLGGGSLQKTSIRGNSDNDTVLLPYITPFSRPTDKFLSRLKLFLPPDSPIAARAERDPTPEQFFSLPFRPPAQIIAEDFPFHYCLTTLNFPIRKAN